MGLCAHKPLPCIRTVAGDGSSKLEVDELRALEFPNLLDPKTNPSGLVYLDHAGATLYGKTQIARHSEVSILSDT